MSHAQLQALAVLLTACSLWGCAAISGYPNDPEKSSTVLTALKPYFDPAKEAAYAALSDGTKRRAMRDDIVLNRVRAYDIEFVDYERMLWSTGNSVTLGGDLAALALGGLATTAGSTSTKTAFSAAGTGVTGANAAINRDLYFQRTLPALLAQMEANRAKAKLKILAGLKQADDQYPLPLADLDLGDLKSAGSMPAAVSNITQQATTDKQTAQSKIDALRTGTVSKSDTTKRLRSWVSPNGQVDTARMKALQDWMNADTVDPTLSAVPPEIFIDLDNPQMEADRTRAISALSVP